MSLPVLAEVEVELAALTMCLFACNKWEHASAVKTLTDWLWTWRQQAHLSDYTQVLSNSILNYRTKKLFSSHLKQCDIKMHLFLRKYLFKHSNKQTHVHVNTLTHATLSVRRKKLWTILACTWALSSYVNLKSWLPLLKNCSVIHKRTLAHEYTLQSKQMKVSLYINCDEDEQHSGICWLYPPDMISHLTECQCLFCPLHK